jgi:AraC-like DNA-binding protein
MLAARVEQTNGPKENKNIGNFKAVILSGFQTAVESFGMRTPLQALCEIVARHTATGTALPIPHVMFRSGTSDDEPYSGVFNPMLCFILQGSKRIIIGDQEMTFGANSVLALSLDLPLTGRLVDGTKAEPHLGIGIDLDQTMVSELLLGLPDAAPIEAPGFCVMPMEDAMVEPLLRLARLADTPSDAKALAPLAVREIIYRALRGPLRWLLCEFGRSDGRTAQIRRTVDWILTHLNQRVSVEELASIAGMSVTSFHRHFKLLTAESPLNFIKQARLFEARNRLLLGQGGVSQIAFAVGYESASQFSREYSRQFGRPPIDDLRQSNLRTGRSSKDGEEY